MTLLQVENLTKRYGGVLAASGVSFSVQAGELLALIGPNGAGKSTTFGMVGGQFKPDAGTVRIDGADITGLSPRAVADRGVGRTFQVAATFSSMSVVENVQTAISASRGRSRAVWPKGRHLFREEALDVLSLLRMAEFADRPCSMLSYGDVKRAELAIALAGQPRLLLMDEPTAGMGPRERADFMELTSRLARERRIGVLFTEQDMDAVFSHADRIVVLVRGAIVAHGTPDEIRVDPEVKRIYLGESGTAAIRKTRRTS